MLNRVLTLASCVVDEQPIESTNELITFKLDRKNLERMAKNKGCPQHSSIVVNMHTLSSMLYG